MGKNILVHLRVAGDQVRNIENLLETAVEYKTRKGWTFVKWRQSDDNYVIELMKRLPDWSEYVVRLYEDGNGVIIYSSGDQQMIHYFKIRDSLRSKIINLASMKIDDILAHPSWICEDDRYFGSSVHLKYNLEGKCPEATNRLQEYQCYERIDYSDDEYKIKIAEQLLESPEIKNKWMKMHKESLDLY